MMHATRLFPVLALALGIAACAPVTTYTDAEAPKRLTLDSATTQLELHFAPGSASLAATDAERLRQLAATGRIDPADRVTIAAAGPPQLAKARAGTVSALLLNLGIVPVAVAAAVPPNRAVVEVTRTLVTLPPCPNWSKISGVDYGN
ncbi:MAG TPA: CpaD family pilus assembly lipoprotein, partial [Stellaceae bacterium]|nr:CpaD family pilus assembly lipoprotein [Stellaceae bacterium]